MAESTINSPIPVTELERRWTAVRAAMGEAGLDVLVMQQSSDTIGGYVRYFTDMPAGGYGVAVVFPRDDRMTVAMHGPLGGDVVLTPDGDPRMPGVGRVVTDAAFPSAAYTRLYDAANIALALRRYARGRIGLLGTSQMPLAFGEYLRQELPDAIFSEASDLVDRVKAIKSPVEQDLIRRCAVLQDGAMELARKSILPGRRGSDVIADVKHYCEERGSEAGVYMCGSSPLGAPAIIAPVHVANRVIQPGDAVSLLVEGNGPGGLYTELGRTFVLGCVPAAYAEEVEFALEAQRFTLEQLRPGAEPAAIWEAYNAYMLDNGRAAETRVHCHGQGYDLVERPLIRHDETLRIAQDMNFAVHPSFVRNGAFVWMCDNWVIGPDGPGERMHTFPQQIIQVG